MKKVAILQSSYIPWKGYFDMIAAVDEFILYDDMQFTKRDWRNRNQIKTPQGIRWLTVPVKTKGKFHQTVRETEIAGTRWAETHWKTLTLNYCRARHFEQVAAVFEPLYLNRRYTHLSVLNRTLIEVVCAFLDITTKISSSCDYTLVDDKTARLADLCKQAGGSVYISGPAAHGYIDEQHFIRCGIELVWFDYIGFREYFQLWGPFAHNVSILDLLFNCGRDAPRYMRHMRS